MKRGLNGTFVNTAMDAYELPRFMPTMDGIETSTGVSALPFGTGPFGGICGDVRRTSWTSDDDFFFRLVRVFLRTMNFCVAEVSDG